MSNGEGQQETTQTISVVPFEMDGHRFGLLASDVQEVLRAVTPSPLPQAPAIVLGVINVRSKLVPLLDVRSRFGLARRALCHTDHLLVARAGSRVVALAVEKTHAMIEVPVVGIDAAPEQGLYGEHVAGIAKLEDGSLVIYDFARFLSESEAARVDAALAPP
jgi:purine-binding chemotaxis protein CheW